MDSPGNAKSATNEPAGFASTRSDSPPVKESPCSDYLNNLSPLELKKVGNIPQGFIGINSPPLVFTSPRITLPCDAHILKRPQVLQLSTEDLPPYNLCAKSPQDDHCKSETILVDDKEDFVAKDYTETQPSNSSSCIDEFLVDPIVMDCANFTFSGDPNGKEVKSNSPDDATPLKTTAPNFKQNSDADEHAGNELDKVEFQEKKKSIVKKMENKENHHDRDGCPDDCLNSLSDASIDHDLQIQQCQDFVTQGAGDINEDKFENATNSISGSFSAVNAGVTVSYLASRHDSEVIMKQRGLLRRCLFDEASPDNSSTKSGSSSASNIMSSGSSAKSAKLERLNLTRSSSSSTSGENKVEELSKHVAANVPLCCSAKFPSLASRPLSIGLHLNSVVGGQKIGPIATSNAELTGCHLGTQEAKSTSSETWHVLNNSTKGCLGIEKVKSSTEESRHDTIVIHKNTTVESPSDSEPQNLLMPLEHCAEGSSFNVDTSIIHTSAKRKCSLEHAESLDEINQMSPKKRRKKESSTSAAVGCKHCNCRKTKCLKLYCDCFAAGLYCSEPCACQGCFNKPEYQDKVNDTRKLIELRNPSAFAPKIVESIDQSSENNMERENRLAPSLARHKKGCNCKRSMCLKKYCECYQANVGCSDNCRCEGCKNVYGTKQGNGLSKQLKSNIVSDGSSGEEKAKPLAANDDSFSTEIHDPLSLTPPTPSLQIADHVKGPLKSQIPLPRFLPSPDSDVTTILSEEPRPTRGADNCPMQVHRSKETSQPGLEDRIVEPSSEVVDEFSPRLESLLNLSHLTPRPGHPVTASSSSSSKARVSISSQGSQIALVSKSRQQSSSSSCSVPRQMIPITPATNLLITDRSAKNPNSGSGISEISEDDTPEILKEASTPTKSLNVSSPNKKRISPPHGHAGSSSSVALKSGRKFILKAVPSFPPLTPCIERRGSKNPDSTDLQDDSRNK